jgi:V/A-type H+/Na+-transporting ATPase subunit D
VALDLPPTRIAYLELKEEQEAMGEGYRFLDEKRLILAGAILAELAGYQEALAGFRAGYAKAAAALRAAIRRHGLEGVAVYPAAVAPSGRLDLRTRSVLGVAVQALECHLDPLAAPGAVDPSAEAEACRAAFRDLIPLLAKLAALAGNLERLRREYLRTTRRARALEDVLLPEVAEALAMIDTVLEEQEREDAVRVRRARGAR